MNKKIGSRNFGKNVYKWKKNLIWLTFLLPTFICLLILTYIPTIKAVNYSFHDVNVIGEIQSNVGFQNYKVLLESSGFRKSILNTLILALMSLLAIPLGFVIACGANGVRNKKAQTVFNRLKTVILLAALNFQNRTIPLTFRNANICILRYDSVSALSHPLHYEYSYNSSQPHINCKHQTWLINTLPVSQNVANRYHPCLPSKKGRWLDGKAQA